MTHGGLSHAPRAARTRQGDASCASRESGADALAPLVRAARMCLCLSYKSGTDPRRPITCAEPPAPSVSALLAPLARAARTWEAPGRAHPCRSHERRKERVRVPPPSLAAGPSRAAAPVLLDTGPYTSGCADVPAALVFPLRRVGAAPPPPHGGGGGAGPEELLGGGPRGSSHW
jgi:hypothetical protein